MNMRQAIECIGVVRATVLAVWLVGCAFLLVAGSDSGEFGWGFSYAVAYIDVWMCAPLYLSVDATVCMVMFRRRPAAREVCLSYFVYYYATFVLSWLFVWFLFVG